MDFENSSLDASLKQIPAYKLPPPQIVWPWSEAEVLRSSDTLHISAVPVDMNIRTFYLQAIKSNDSESNILPPPIISASSFIPQSLIEHLMRNKRSSALGKKFESGAEITNMEGAMHTFVVPIVPRCETAGDYGFSAGHRATPRVISKVKVEGKDVLMTRSVILSATIHLDFELPSVMMELCRLRKEEVLGKDLNADLNWRILSKAEKQNDALREGYDDALRKHMVFHLTSGHRLPALSDPSKITMSLSQTVSFLGSLINSQDPIVTIRMNISYRNYDSH